MRKLLQGLDPGRRVGLAAALLWGSLVALPLPAAATLPLFSVARDGELLRVVSIGDGSTLGSPLTITPPGNTVRGCNGLATHPQTGVLYALVRLADGFPPDRWLVTIRASTGDASIVGNTGARFAGLAFDAVGTLYAVTGDGESTLIPETLYTLSLVDASPTFVTILGNGGFGETIGFNPDDGFLYHASGFNDGMSADTRVFEKINLTTLAVTNIPLSGDSYSEMTALFFSGSAFTGADNETGAEGEILLSVTPGGVVTQIGSTDHVAKGLAFRPLPAPALGEQGLTVLALALLALVGAALVGRLRTRRLRG